MTVQMHSISGDELAETAKGIVEMDREREIKSVMLDEEVNREDAIGMLREESVETAIWNTVTAVIQDWANGGQAKIRLQKKEESELYGKLEGVMRNRMSDTFFDRMPYQQIPEKISQTIKTVSMGIEKKGGYVRLSDIQIIGKAVGGLNEMAHRPLTKETFEEICKELKDRGVAYLSQKREFLQKWDKINEDYKNGTFRPTEEEREQIIKNHREEEEALASLRYSLEWYANQIWGYVEPIARRAWQWKKDYIKENNCTEDIEWDTDDEDYKTNKHILQRSQWLLGYLSDLHKDCAIDCGIQAGYLLDDIQYTRYEYAKEN